MKLYLQEKSHNGFNAGFKARVDCDKILERNGFRPFFFMVKRYYLFQPLYYLYEKFVIPFILRKYETCFIQYPYYLYRTKGDKVYKWLFDNYPGEIQCLIHDVEGYRKGESVEPALKYLLSKSNKIIVHTPKMKEQLINDCSISPSKIRILYLFDYLTDCFPSPVDLNGKTIIFAGNLGKSPFLSELFKLPKDLSFNLYGAYSNNIQNDSRCFYKGKFQPDNISAIEGNWGLVWDGNCLDTCNGPFGNYLKTNSSHKIALYISACKPVIVWKQSSLSRYIVDNKLGIAVNSLYEISEKLSYLTEQEKLDIIKNVTEFSRYLRSGKMLETCLL